MFKKWKDVKDFKNCYLVCFRPKNIAINDRLHCLYIICNSYNEAVEKCHWFDTDDLSYATILNRSFC